MEPGGRSLCLGWRHWRQRIRTNSANKRRRGSIVLKLIIIVVVGRDDEKREFNFEEQKGCGVFIEVEDEEGSGGECLVC